MKANDGLTQSKSVEAAGEPVAAARRKQEKSRGRERRREKERASTASPPVRWEERGKEKKGQKALLLTMESLSGFRLGSARYLMLVPQR